MTPQTPSAFSGDQAKAEVGLNLSGLTDGQFYLLGDQLAGEITVTSQQDMQLRSIVFKLDYIIRGKWEAAIIPTGIRYAKAPRTLKGGQLNKVPIEIPYRFSRPSYKGEYLSSFWRLNVLLDYDSSQYEQSFVDRVSQAFTSEQKHVTSFEIPVRSGQGTYRVAPQKLPVRLFDLSPLLKPAYIIPFTFLCWIMGLALMSAHPDDMLILPVFALVALSSWLVLHLSTFQMTPMEIKPLRDGQLRLRILDRGNDHLKNAIVGFRLLECYMTKDVKYNPYKKSTRFQKSFPFAEVARREDHLYEAVIPWPALDLPTTRIIGKVGYKWEVFLQVPNPLTGGMQEKSWPINVSWEPFRLTPPSEAALKKEELEVLKLKELEHLRRTL